MPTLNEDIPFFGETTRPRRTGDPKPRGEGSRSRPRCSGQGIPASPLHHRITSSMISGAIPGAISGAISGPGASHQPTLTDGQWARIERHIIGNARTRGASGRDNRMFVEAVLWLARTGAPWRDLPGTFGSWNSVCQRCGRWGRKGVWDRIFGAMSDDPGFPYRIVECAIVWTHADAGRGLSIRRRGRC